MKARNFEFSKIFIFFISLITVIISIVSIVFCFKFQTTEPLNYLIPAVFTEMAAGTGFYYWKARSENKIKITLSAIERLNKMGDLTE